MKSPFRFEIRDLNLRQHHILEYENLVVFPNKLVIHSKYFFFNQSNWKQNKLDGRWVEKFSVALPDNSTPFQKI
jgi:hypothetical protein